MTQQIQPRKLIVITRYLHISEPDNILAHCSDKTVSVYDPMIVLVTLCSPGDAYLTIVIGTIKKVQHQSLFLSLFHSECYQLLCRPN